MPERGDPLERWLYAGALAALIGGAWAVLAGLGASTYAPYLSHQFLSETRDWPSVAARVALFLVGWTVMSIAMMLPSSLPLLTVFHTITSGAWRLVALLVSGYLCIWAVFGLAALLADGALHELVEASPWLSARSHVI